jgi:hypothetical protein
MPELADSEDPAAVSPPLLADSWLALEAFRFLAGSDAAAAAAATTAEGAMNATNAERTKEQFRTKEGSSLERGPPSVSLQPACANADFVHQEGLGIRYMSFIPLPSGGRSNGAARNKPQ